MGSEAKKSYRRIKAVTPTLEILIFLANQREPVSGQDIADGVNLKYDTTLCYLASLEDFKFVEKIGEHWELGMGAAMLWAKMKAKKQEAKAQSVRDIELLQNGDI